MAYIPVPNDDMENMGMRGLTHSSRITNASTRMVFDDPIPLRPEWHGRAACGRNGVLGDDPAVRVRIMFPERGDKSRGVEACAVCPVTAECEAANRIGDLSHAREVGIWFGTTGRMRRGMPAIGRCPCGTQFDRTKPGQVYCSDECRIEGRRKSNRTYQQIAR
jgi:hypothetical protein